MCFELQNATVFVNVAFVFLGKLYIKSLSSFN